MFVFHSIFCYRYNDLADVITAVSSINPTVIKGFDASCFDGIYVTGDVTAEYIEVSSLASQLSVVTVTATDTTVGRKPFKNNGHSHLTR
jgi:hypothetical protein